MHRTRHIKNINILNWKRAGRQEETPSQYTSQQVTDKSFALGNSNFSN